MDLLHLWVRGDRVLAVWRSWSWLAWDKHEFPSLELHKKGQEPGHPVGAVAEGVLTLPTREACDSVTLLTDDDRFLYFNKVLRKWAG